MEYNGYLVRVNAYDGYAEKIAMLKLVADYEAIVAVKHQGSTKENPHYHIVIKTQVKDQAFRVRMKKVFDQGKGNAHMSIKTWDGNIDAIAYLFHEDDEAQLVIQHNVSNETIEKARERNRQVQVKIEQAKDRASWRLEEEVFLMVQPGASADYIARTIILTALRKDKYVPNDYLLKAMVTKIQFKLLNGDVSKEEEFADGIVQWVFHRYN